MCSIDISDLLYSARKSVTRSHWYDNSPTHVRMSIMVDHHPIHHIVWNNNPFQSTIFIFPTLEKLGNRQRLIGAPMFGVVLRRLISLWTLLLDEVCNRTLTFLSHCYAVYESLNTAIFLCPVSQRTFMRIEQQPAPIPRTARQNSHIVR